LPIGHIPIKPLVFPVRRNQRRDGCAIVFGEYAREIPVRILSVARPTVLTDSFLRLPPAQNFAFFEEICSKKVVFCAAGISCLFIKICGSTYKIKFISCARLPGRRFVIATSRSPQARSACGVSLRTHPRARREWFSSLLLESTTLPRNTLRFFRGALATTQRQRQKLHNTCGAI
jgi:hypothetical protein